MLTYELGWKGFDYDQIEQNLNELGPQGWEALETAPIAATAITNLRKNIQKGRYLWLCD